MLTVRIHARVAELDPQVWDALGHDPFTAHAALQALERAQLPDVRLWYATVSDDAGRVVAAAPFSEIGIDAARLTHGVFRGFIRTVRTVQPRFLRTRLMICGTPLSVGSSAVRWAQGSDPRPAIRALAAALECHGRREGAAWCVFKEFAEHDLALARAALGDGAGWLLAPSEPNSRLSIVWDDWDGYLASLRSDYRYKIKKALRQFAGARAEVDVVPLADGYGDELHRLYEAVLTRAPIQLERLTARFFLELGHALRPRAWLIRFHWQSRVIGWVAAVVDGGTVYDLFHGIDYEANRRCALYFNQLAAVIRFAIEGGASCLSLGQSTEIAKGRFGGQSAPLWIALRHRSAAIRRALHLGQRVLFPPKQVARHRVFRAELP